MMKDSKARESGQGLATSRGQGITLETLEEVVRARVQEFIQQILEGRYQSYWEGRSHRGGRWMLRLAIAVGMASPGS